MVYIPDPQTYRDAAEIIRTHGFYQGYFYEAPYNDDHGYPPPRSGCKVCPVGAIYQAGNGDPRPTGADSIGSKAVAWADRYADEHDLIDRELNIPQWADKPGRTQAEVIDLLEKLAEGAQRAREEKS